VTTGTANDAWVVGIDIGGTGARARAVHLQSGAIREHRTTGTSATSTGAPTAVVEAASAVAQDLPKDESIAAVVVGASGFSTMASGLGVTRQRVSDVLRCDVIGFAPDILIAHVGALGDRPGTVLAVGTGAIALSRTTTEYWHRVDGWGHLLGDLGSASWIGRQGLVAALRQHDGRTTDAAPLLVAATNRFGDPLTWPRQFSERADRAGVFASFAPVVLGSTDHASLHIHDQALDNLADTAATALSQNDVPPLLALTGGVFDNTEFRATLVERVRARTGAEIVPASGSALDGAIVLARGAIAGRRPTAAGSLAWA
jgi:N-acetylglucosamine kinase-like BadF-type ATPase